MTQAANLGALGTNAGTTGILAATGGGTAGTAGVTGFKNRLINGACVIDQRNSGASVACPATNVAYAVDRTGMYTNAGAGVFTAQQSSIAPTGFSKSLSITATTPQTVTSGQEYKVFQIIEGNNVADLNFGSAVAATFTISFWVRSSIAGVYSFGLANDGGSRTYGTTYTISSANTWEYKTITVAGDTSGTWLSNNGFGIQCNWYLGAGSNFQTTAGSWQTKSGSYGSSGSVYAGANSSGTQWVQTSGATFYITGLQFEVGTAATNFDVRSYGTELDLCERYYQQIGGESYTAVGFGVNYETVVRAITIKFNSTMRTAPSTTISGTLIATERTSFDTDISSITGWSAGTDSANAYMNKNATSGANGYPVQIAVKNGTRSFLCLSAEL